MTLEEFDSWFREKYKRKSSALIAVMMAISDSIAVMISFGIGFLAVKLYYILMDNWGGINFKSFTTYWPYLPIFIIIFILMKLYPGVALAPAEETRGFTIASFLTHGGILVSRYIQYEIIDSIFIAFIISFIFSTIILMICREFMNFIIRLVKIKGIPVVVYGAGDKGRLVIDRLLNSKKTGYEPALILDNEVWNGDSYRGIPIIQDTLIGPEIVKRHKIRMAIIAMPNIEQPDQTSIINNSVSAFRYNVLIPDFFKINNIWMTVRDFGGVLGFATSHRLKMYWNLAIKRFLDIVMVSLGGIIILPFFIIISLLIKVSSFGPVLYKHKRLGLNGKYFNAYKFRTMIKNADKILAGMLEKDQTMREEWEQTHKLKKDPRITTIGKFLRKFSFDEFPQLLNILKGEMSLVGPRPVTDDEITKYGENARRVLTVKPGLTGLWQISGRSDTNYNERVSYDLYYLQSWSVWLDLWIIFKTPRVIFKGKGAY